MTETIDTAQPEALRLLQWYDEDGFAQGTKAPSKWVLQAASELRNLRAANVYTSDLCTQALDEVRRLTDELAAAEARNAALTDDAARARAVVVREAVRVAKLLAHCPGGECETCSEIICPHGDTMHFHHDGCPTCEQHEQAARTAASISTKGEADA